MTLLVSFAPSTVVQRLQRLIALTLLALWLPATLHCDLETAGIEDIFGGHDHASTAHRHAQVPHDYAGEDTQHSTDGLSYRLDSLALKTPLPAFAFLYTVEAIPLLVSIDLPASFVVESGTSPPEVARTWHFLTRAAPPSRAPSFSV